MELKNSLYFGDCLDVLRELSAQHPQGFVDLIYLDPPFNSKRDYNLLFKSPKGGESNAQITAFEDSWHWGMQAEKEFDELLSQPNTDVAEMMRALRAFLGENDMMAYLTMMANRLLVMQKVLKDTGSLYLHCDPTASHYLKVVLDGVFGADNYVNEIIWRRTTTKNDYLQGAVNWPRCHDTILMYYRSFRQAKQNGVFSQPFGEYDEEYVKAFYRFVEEGTGRKYRLSDLTAPGRGSRGHPQYELMGVTRYWRYNQEKMNRLIQEGRIIQTKPGSVPAYKRYLDEVPGVAISDVWEDIRPVQGVSNEFLGYPTQKPQGLLERIIEASSRRGDIVLDPFCGCGTAIHAAQKLDRLWIGIDITHLAISLIEKRLNDAFPGIKYEVFGTPKDYEGAADLARRDKYQFQWWALSLIRAQPYQGKKKGADGGIDGLIYFKDDAKNVKSIVVSVKGGEHVTRNMIGDLIAVVDRQKASIGLFVTLARPTTAMITEAAAAGFYESPHHGKFPKIQILTIEGLMNGTERPQYMDLSTGITFKQAKREIKIDAEQDELFDTEVE